jgi:hypothetical protein
MAQTMGKPWTARRIHLWLAVILALPLLLTAVTGVVLAFRGPEVMTLGIPAKWLPGGVASQAQQISAYLPAKDGGQWVGTMTGLWQIKDGQAVAVQPFAGMEIVALAPVASGDAPVVGVKMAVWAMQDGKWQPSRRGRVRNLMGLPDGSVFAIVGGRGDAAESKPFVSADGVHWQPAAQANQAVAQLPAQTDARVPLVQLVRDLHSGVFIVGQAGSRWWNMLLGVVLSTLGLTGLLMWLRTERRKTQVNAAVSQGGV